MKTKFIVNPTSGKCLGEKFSRKLTDLGDVICTSPTGRSCARELAKAAVIMGFDRIVAVGGDGIINETINGMAEAAGLNIPLGIIPAGVGNNFAKNLGIPLGFRESLETAMGDCVSRIDLGKANDRYFANVISFGFDAKVTGLARDIKRKYGFLPKDLTYLVAALRENIVSGAGRYPITASVNGFRLVGDAAFLVIANGASYGGIFRIAPDADMRDGLLDLCWVKPMGRVRILANIHKVVQGVHTTLPEVKMLKANYLTVSSPEPLICEIDGEVSEPKREYKICVIPRALKVLVPSYPAVEMIKIEVRELQPA